MDIEAEKTKCRKALSKNRKNAKAKHAKAHILIAEQFFACQPASQNWQGKAIAGYLPIASEINVLPLLAELRSKGTKILLPAIIAKDKPLEWRLWNEGDELVKESFGTMAPCEGAEVHLPDMILAPLLGFDEACYRLGYGGGFYDRSLQALRQKKPVIAIGFAYDEQKLDNVPRDVHDIRLDGIVTPSYFYSGSI